MITIDAYFDRSGKRHENTTSHMAPFELMQNAGDWFQVRMSDLNNNSASLSAMCSRYRGLLNRRFEFKTIIFDRERYCRVTLLDDDQDSTVSDRVETFTDSHGQVQQNIDQESRYPFWLMGVGDWFDVIGSRRDAQGALNAARRVERSIGAVFTLEMPLGAYPRVIRTS